jgi:heme-degrading monooxygenase HmoA
MYVRVWEYQVEAGQSAAFRAAYGAEGDWAQLFRKGRGYAGTALYRNTTDGTRFVTVDRWSSEAAWTSFLGKFREPYDALDTQLAGLSLSQRELVEGTA